MSRLGSAAMAKQIADPEKPLPEGWSKLGKGAFREALLGPDGICYKRARWSYDSKRHNSREWENYKALRKILPDPVRVPRMRYFPSCNVIAAECVRGVTGDAVWSDPEAKEVFRTAKSALLDAGIHDTHTDNLVVVGPHAYVIDLGEHRS